MNGRQIRFENTLDLSSSTQQYLQDYSVFGQTLFPAAGYVELCFGAGRAVLKAGQMVLSNLRVHHFLPLAIDKPCKLQIELNATSTSTRQIKIKEQAEPASAIISTAEIHVLKELSPLLPSHLTSLPKNTNAQSGSSVYDQLRRSGITPGPRFQVIESVCEDDRAVYAELALRKGTAHSDYVCHPALLDGCFQVCAYLLRQECADAVAYLPESIERFTLYRALSDRVSAYVCAAGDERPSAQGKYLDITLCDPDTSEILATLERVKFRGISQVEMRYIVQEHENVVDLYYEVEWKEERRLLPPKPALQTQNLTKPSSPTWVVFADDAGVGSIVAKQLEAAGESVLVVTATRPGTELEKGNLASASITKEEISSFFKGLNTAHLKGVIHSWALDFESADCTYLDQAQAKICGSVLHLVQVLADLTAAKPPQTWLITQGAQLLSDQKSIALMQSPLVGLSRVIALEHPELNLRLVDLDPDYEPSQAANYLFEELQIDDHEDHVALRKGRRLIARIIQGRAKDEAVPPPQLQVQHDSYKLVLRPGTAKMELEAKELAPLPPENAIEVAILSSSISSDDARMIQEERWGTSLGTEFAGIVTVKSADGGDLHVGDHVFGIGTATHTDRLVTKSDLVARKPENLTFEEAAALAIPFLTAYACLCHLTQLSAGATILIHVDSSGIGLVAVQIALRLGARVFATANNARDVAYLQKLGVGDIFDGDNAKFADQIMNITQECGVDIVLNSLTGTFVAESLAIVKDAGQFIAIGKQGAWTEEEVAQAYPFVTYKVFSLDRFATDSPQCIKPILGTLREWIDSGNFLPLKVRAFPIQRAPEAFESYKHSKFKTKTVLKSTNHNPTMRFRSNGTYIVTGGLGGIGLELCDWLIDFGAKNIAILGRSAPSATGQEYMAKWRAAGANIQTYRVDVADSAVLSQVLNTIRKEWPPIVAIFHAAAVVSDAILHNQTWQNFEKVLRAKVNGSWLLHELTREDRLDYFVMFSSASSLFGSTGQGNYAAANAFMNALAHHRHLEGLPALSINWGAWAQVGQAAQLIKRRLWTKGQALSLVQGFKALSTLLDDSETASIGVVNIDEEAFFAEWNADSPLLSLVRVQYKEENENASSLVKTLRELIAQIESNYVPDQFEITLRQYIEEQVRCVLKWPAEEPLHEKSDFLELGMDSFLAVELCNRCMRDLGRRSAITAGTVYIHPSVKALSEYFLKQLQSSTAQKTALDSRRKESGATSMVGT